ncbi:hypothetical protein [Pseudocitrobacter corydidari]|uniref:Trypsin-like peptidase domain-containing protein n=1 Tax=Pseudocitrobacter corydidari TaxID=2891570 RepID=A0ABY3S6D0_9ENTR|nr:hypothetical protein [Pseudocitrobacter corydidari]UGS42286.1 hypothetical protein G163CM_30140 [Pseudocitrobacter corydidari]
MTCYQINNLCKVTAFIYISDDFIGCAVIFKNNNEIMLATAFHVLESLIHNFSDNKHLIQIVDEKKRIYKVNELRGNINESKRRDIALLVLDGDINNLEEICFFNPLSSPNLELISRCRSHINNIPTSLYSKEQIEKLDDFYYYINIDKSIMEDSSGRWGASALQGISGAGVFIKIHQQLVLVGIISSIPDDGLFGKVRCSNASCFIEIHDSLKANSSNNYDFGSSILKESLLMLKDENIDSVIHDWENLEENKKYNNNIDRKINILHVASKIDQEKKKIILNLLSGNNFARARMINYPNIETSYSTAHLVFGGEDMTLYVNNRAEANKGYQNIKSDYLNILSDSLSPHGLQKDEILLLRNKDIAFWLANCDLDFLEED